MPRHKSPKWDVPSWDEHKHTYHSWIVTVMPYGLAVRRLTCKTALMAAILTRTYGRVLYATKSEDSALRFKQKYEEAVAKAVEPQLSFLTSPLGP